MKKKRDRNIGPILRHHFSVPARPHDTTFGWRVVMRTGRQQLNPWALSGEPHNWRELCACTRKWLPAEGWDERKRGWRSGGCEDGWILRRSPRTGCAAVEFWGFGKSGTGPLTTDQPAAEEDALTTSHHLADQTKYFQRGNQRLNLNALTHSVLNPQRPNLASSMIQPFCANELLSLRAPKAGALWFSQKRDPTWNSPGRASLFWFYVSEHVRAHHQRQAASFHLSGSWLL